ncbi:MAG: hypothetical protein ACRD3H_07810 [Terriglobales bacterium]
MNIIDETLTETKKPASASSELHCCEKCGKPLAVSYCGEILRLRCFVYRYSRDTYVAECIDLDISTEGATMREACCGLHDALRGYLAVVCDGNDTRGLLPRQSPLSHRLRYRFELWKDLVFAVFSDRDRNTAEKLYSVPYQTQC